MRGQLSMRTSKDRKELNMGQIHYKASDAIKEHLIGGNEIS